MGGGASSTIEEAIREAFEHQRAPQHGDALVVCGICRQHSCIGIRGARNHLHLFRQAELLGQRRRDGAERCSTGTDFGQGLQPGLMSEGFGPLVLVQAPAEAKVVAFFAIAPVLHQPAADPVGLMA